MVNGSLALGFTSPNNTDAKPAPVPYPGMRFVRIPLTSFAHGTITGPGA